MRIFIKIFLLLALFAPLAYEQDGRVAIAAKDLSKGAVIKKEDITFTKLAPADIQKNYILESEIAFFTGPTEYAALVNIPKGAQITRNIIASNESKTIKLQPEYRLYPIKVSAADYGLFSAGLYTDITITNYDKGYLLGLLNNILVVDKQQLEEGNYLYLALRSKEAQDLFIMESSGATIHFILTKKVFNDKK